MLPHCTGAHARPAPPGRRALCQSVTTCAGPLGGRSLCQSVTNCALLVGSEPCVKVSQAAVCSLLAVGLVPKFQKLWLLRYGSRDASRCRAARRRRGIAGRACAKLTQAPQGAFSDAGRADHSVGVIAGRPPGSSGCAGKAPGRPAACSIPSRAPYPDRALRSPRSRPHPGPTFRVRLSGRAGVRLTRNAPSDAAAWGARSRGAHAQRTVR